MADDNDLPGEGKLREDARQNLGAYPRNVEVVVRLLEDRQSEGRIDDDVTSDLTATAIMTTKPELDCPFSSLKVPAIPCGSLADRLLDRHRRQRNLIVRALQSVGELRSDHRDGVQIGVLDARQCIRETGLPNVVLVTIPNAMKEEQCRLVRQGRLRCSCPRRHGSNARVFGQNSDSFSFTKPLVFGASNLPCLGLSADSWHELAPSIRWVYLKSSYGKPMVVFSWQMAEELAAAHMRALGFAQVRRMPDGIDGGIDVTATNAVAQVKYHAAPIGGPDVQRLRGAAPVTEHLLFYSSSGYTSAAAKAAELAKVCLFSYSTANVVEAENEPARFLQARLVGDTSEVAMAELLPAQLRATVYGRWFPRYVAEFNVVVQDVTSGRMTVSEEEAQRIFDQANSLLAVSADFERLNTLISGNSGVRESLNGSDWVSVRLYAADLSEIVRAIETQLRIDPKQARRLNGAQARKLKSKTYELFRIVAGEPAPFVATVDSSFVDKAK